MPRSVVTIDDLTDEEMEAVFRLADRFLDEMATPDRPYRVGGRTPLAENFILATLFFEPSTRTRLSFEAAMMRLGGRCLSSAEGGQTSAAKGETIADTIRVVSNYADAIVIRHPLEGAARVAADYASVPVINAGDGSHEHPTQTLCDLYTLRVAQAQKGRPRTIRSLKGLNVVVWGDLRHGRTVHSLVYALARLRARIIPIPAPGCELPEHVRSRLARDYDCFPITRQEIHSRADDGFPADVDVLYVTPEGPHQPALFADVCSRITAKQLAEIRAIKSIDAFYSTRLQLERLKPTEGVEYPAVNAGLLKDRRYRTTKVLHPLPRVDELSYEIDEDPRSVYFQQASYGVPVRMALLASLLNLKQAIGPGPAPSASRYRSYAHEGGLACSNEGCVSRKKNEQRYLSPKFWIVDEERPTLRCLYCDFEQEPKAVGRASTKKYTLNMPEWHEIDDRDLVFFADERQAVRAKFEPKKGKRRPKGRKSASRA